MTGSPDRAPIHEQVARTAAGTPDAVAVLDDAGTALTYAELDRRADDLAGRLVALGAGPGAPVAVCLDRCPNLVVGLLAVWRAGAAYVPLGPDDPAVRHAAVTAATGAVAVLTDEPRGIAFAAGGPAPVFVTPSTWPDEMRAAGATLPEVSGVDTAYVLHTSGSTATPKGVVVSHAGIANRVRWTVETHGIGPGDRVLQKTALTFDAAGWEIFAPLVAGGTVVLAAPGAERDPAAVLAAVARHRVTVLQLVPSALRAMVTEPGWDGCSALRLLCCAGEPLHSELVQEFLDAVEPAGGDVAVWNTYGPTECSIDVTAHPVDEMQRTGPVSIGRPITGMRVVVADRHGAPMPAGVEGELCAAGVGLADGYLGRPGLTAQRFVPDPTGAPGSRLYRTGDMARLRADGTLEYLGRTDQQVKVDGVRIEPGEIETALAAHPDVLESAVNPYTAANGATRLAAYVRTRDGAVPADLRDVLADRLPRTHLPAVFVALPSLPTTTSGKLDRAALPRPRAARAGAGSGEVSLITGLWRDLLGVDQIGEDDDFFALGGSSLQLTQLSNRLRTVTGREIGLDLLLRATSVAEQAELVAADRATAEPVRPAARDRALPLSSGQRRLWLLDTITPTPREWVSGHFLPVPDDLDADVVRRALDVLVDRHEALRTRFAVQDGEPVQVVERARPVEVECVTAAEPDVADVVNRAAERGFTLTEGQLVRPLLIRTGTRQALVLLMHHIVCDGWSAAVLEREFTEVVDALRTGRAPELAELPVQYADYAVWEAESLTPEVLSAELEHWRSALEGSEPLTLHADRPRPPARDARGAVATFTLPAATVRGLAELAARHRTTLFATLLTGYMTTLARHAGQWDVVVGTPVAGRDRQELEGVVGFFLNSLALRTRLAPDLSFTDAVRAVAETCGDAFAHQRLPFEQLVADLAGPRDLSRTPLYQVAFDLHDDELTGTPAAADDLAALLGSTRIAKTDLTLYARSQPDGSLLGVLEYATALFDPDTVARFGQHLANVLAAVAADASIPLGSLPMAGSGELHDVLATAATPPPAAGAVPGSVADAVERRAAETPDAPALVADGATRSYAELDARANRLAHLLRDLGVREDDVVAVLLDRGPELVTALLAVWKAGAAYLPLDPGTPAARAADACRDSRVTVAVSEHAHGAALAGFDGRTVLVDSDADRAALADRSSARPQRADDPDLLAYVIQTSGSTGRPKGVAVTHGGLANHVRWAADRLAGSAPGGGALFSSAAFDLVEPNIWAPLVTGRPVHLLPEGVDLTELGDRLDAAAPLSFLKLTPGHLDVLGSRLPDDRLARLAGTVVVAGEVLPQATARRWAGLLGDGRLINEYGPTETAVGATVHDVTAPVGDRPVPIGRALPGVSTHVLGPRSEVEGVDVPGEIVVGGAGVARGYVGRPGLTAQRFVPDPFGPPGSRAYRTGDRGRRRADGAVEFLGRADEQVKIRGYRVEPGEVGAALASHPGVADAVVVAVTDDPGPRLVGYYVPADPGADLADAVRTHLAGLLPAHMVPQSLVALSALPLTANGKLDRAALPRTVTDDPGVPAALDGPVEERIAALFAELLARPVGADTHFFNAGGNSLLAVRLIAQLQADFDVDLPIRAVFEGATVAELAAVIENELRAELERMSPEELAAEAERIELSRPR